MNKENVDEVILALYSEHKWQDIVNVNCSLDKLHKSKLFWVLPTINDLRWIKEILNEYNLVGLISIGSGCGLLEWLFEKYSGLDVSGIELDNLWWRSKYSPPLFLKNTIFIRENNEINYFLTATRALLFCYFNNASAFCHYIENYKGNIIFVIGPKADQQRWTDPMPFDIKFNAYGWKLIYEKEMERSCDYITVYTKSISY